MSKKNEKAAAPQEEETTLEMQAGVDIGVSHGEFESVDPNENIPHFVPGKSWAIGQTLAGRFIRVEARYSTLEKKPNWRKTGNPAKPNEVTRSAIILQDMTTDDFFAIWMVGTLANFFPRVRENTPVSLTYKGLAEKAFKEGQSVPHIFDFALGKGHALMSQEEIKAAKNPPVATGAANTQAAAQA